MQNGLVALKDMPHAFTRFVCCNNATPGRSATRLVFRYSPSRSPRADAGIQASVNNAAARTSPARQSDAFIVVSLVIFAFIINSIVCLVLVCFPSASGWRAGYHRTQQLKALLSG